MDAIGIVVARGGSQRVAYKNIAPLLGRPALAYTLDHARASTRLSKIVVSTEDPRIAETARGEGADVVDRPAELAQPDTRLDHVLRHAVDAEAGRSGRRPEFVAMLYGAVPVRPEGFIDECLEILATTGAHSVRSLAPAHDRHPAWSVKLDERGRIKEYLGSGNVYRRQDLPPVFFYTGACVAIRTDVLFSRTSDADNFGYLGTDQAGAVHEPHECVEIHEPIDLEWAEFLLRRRLKFTSMNP